MARLTILVLLAVSASCSVAISEEEMHDIVHGMALQCEEVYPITEDDAELLHQHQPPIGPNGVCFLTCMFEKLGLIGVPLASLIRMHMENGVFNAEHAKATVLKYVADQPDVQSKMEALLDICEKEVGSGDEKCGPGMELFNCFKTHAESVGFMPDA